MKLWSLHYYHDMHAFLTYTYKDVLCGPVDLVDPSEVNSDKKIRLKPYSGIFITTSLVLLLDLVLHSLSCSSHWSKNWVLHLGLVFHCQSRSWSRKYSLGLGLAVRPIQRPQDQERLCWSLDRRGSHIVYVCWSLTTVVANPEVAYFVVWNELALARHG